MFIVAVKCDESGTIVAASCNLCPYEFYSDEYYYEYYYNDGTYCNGDCSWNSYLDECQIKGIFLMTKVYILTFRREVSYFLHDMLKGLF